MSLSSEVDSSEEESDDSDELSVLSSEVVDLSVPIRTELLESERFCREVDAFCIEDNESDRFCFFFLGILGDRLLIDASSRRLGGVTGRGVNMLGPNVAICASMSARDKFRYLFGCTSCDSISLLEEDECDGDAIAAAAALALEN